MNDKLVLIKILNCVANEIIGNKIDPPLPSLLWGNWDRSQNIARNMSNQPWGDWRIDQLSKNGSPNYQTRRSSWERRLFIFSNCILVNKLRSNQRCWCGTRKWGARQWRGGSSSGLDGLDSTKEEDVKVEGERGGLIWEVLRTRIPGKPGLLPFNTQPILAYFSSPDLQKLHFWNSNSR